MSLGKILWHDLTVDNATEVRDFYSQVVGWKHSPIDMKGYDDYVMLVDGTEPGDMSGATGICHARGSNADMPPQWMIYISVPSVKDAIDHAIRLGGDVVTGPRSAGGKQFAVIKDPASAVFAIIEP